MSLLLFFIACAPEAAERLTPLDRSANREVPRETCDCADNNGDGGVDEGLSCLYPVTMSASADDAYLFRVDGGTPAGSGSGWSSLDTFNWKLAAGDHDLNVKAGDTAGYLAGFIASLTVPGAGPTDYDTGLGAWYLTPKNTVGWQTLTAPSSTMVPDNTYATTACAWSTTLGLTSSWVWGQNCANPVTYPKNFLHLDFEVCPDALELCDGVDNDADGVADELFPDADGDGLADCVDPDELDVMVVTIEGVDYTVDAISIGPITAAPPAQPTEVFIDQEMPGTLTIDEGYASETVLSDLVQSGTALHTWEVDSPDTVDLGGSVSVAPFVGDDADALSFGTRHPPDEGGPLESIIGITIEVGVAEEMVLTTGLDDAGYTDCTVRLARGGTELLVVDAACADVSYPLLALKQNGYEPPLDLHYTYGPYDPTSGTYDAEPYWTITARATLSEPYNVSIMD